uniref:Uncharacterized protein n=1 Tax=Ascaris lumbricoides TaxID=6252 RepID=A0A9J2Q0P5_ASCLU
MGRNARREKFFKILDEGFEFVTARSNSPQIRRQTSKSDAISTTTSDATSSSVYSSTYSSTSSQLSYTTTASKNTSKGSSSSSNPPTATSSSSHASDAVQVAADEQQCYCKSPPMNSPTDVTQRDEYDIFACNIISQMIGNLRVKQVRDRKLSLIKFSKPFDLNMPSTIRKRERIDDFLLDPPLTNIGAHFSRQLGLSMIHEVPTVIYTSPQLANIQTGRKLLEGIPVGVGWNIEPGLAGYYPIGADCPKFDVKLKKDTVLKVPYINSVLGKETLEEFHRRIAHVVSKLDFPLGESTIIVAEACVIDAIVQTFIRNGKGLTQKQRASLETRIPCLSMMHFDVKDNGKWKMSAASLPGLLSECAQMRSIPDVNFIVRPIFDY